jgi:hypothetical protein
LQPQQNAVAARKETDHERSAEGLAEDVFGHADLPRDHRIVFLIHGLMKLCGSKDGLMDSEDENQWK